MSVLMCVLTWSILMIGSFSSTSFSINDTLATLLDNDNLLRGELLSQFTILSLLYSHFRTLNSYSLAH